MSAGGGLSMLKRKSWPLRVVAESGDKVGGKEEDDDPIEDLLGYPRSSSPLIEI